MKKTLLFLILYLNLYADVVSVFLENDFVAQQDRHYTNGFSLAWLSENDTNNLKKHDSSLYELISKIPYINHDTKNQSISLVFNHLVFTPTDTKRKDKIKNDLPYAGVSTVDFLIYKWNENYFHQYGISFGLIGPSTRAKELQNGAHKIVGVETMKGWDNQLNDEFVYGLSYAYGYKAYEKKFTNKKLDITNSIKLDFGNGFRDILLGSMIRFGKNIASSFNTVGSTFGGNKDSALGLENKLNKNYGWSINYGLYYNFIEYFYISDFDKSYKIDKDKRVLAQITSLDFYKNTYKLSFTYKTSHFFLEKEKRIVDSWGGVSFQKVF